MASIRWETLDHKMLIFTVKIQKLNPLSLGMEGKAKRARMYLLLKINVYTRTKLNQAKTFI